jgi:preprotein translocase subunit YajC
MDKETVTLQIADNTKIRLQRDHISSIRPPSGEGGQ